MVSAVPLRSHSARQAYPVPERSARESKNGRCIMRASAKIAVALSFIGVTAISTTAAVQAQGFYLDAPGVHIGVGDRFQLWRFNAAQSPSRQSSYDYTGR